MADASVSISVGPQTVKAVVMDSAGSIERTCEQLDGLMDRMQLKAEAEVVDGPGACSALAGSEMVACQPKESKLMYFKPHDGYAKGCPNPPCFEERHKTAQGVHKHMQLHDGEIGKGHCFAAQLAHIEQRMTCTSSHVLHWRRTDSPLLSCACRKYAASMLQGEQTICSLRTVIDRLLDR